MKGHTTEETKSTCELLQMKKGKRKNSKEECGSEKESRCLRAISIWKLVFGNKDKLTVQETVNCSVAARNVKGL